MTATAATARGDGRLLPASVLGAIRIAWVAVIVAIIVVSVAAFETHFDGGVELIADQGPLSVQPDLARELELRLFPEGVLAAGQTLTHLAGMFLFTIAGIAIFLRRSRDWRVALSSAALMLAGAALFVPSNALAQARPGWEPLVNILGVFDAGPEFWRSAAGVALVLFALVFPDGRFVPRWGKYVAAGFGALVALWVAFPSVPLFNVGDWPTNLQPLWTLGLALLATYAQLHRYVTDSDPEARRQTRLVVISLTAIVGSFLLIWVLDPDLASTVDLGLVLVTERTQTIYDLNLLSVLTFGVILFPVSIGVSVARYRLWDMDLVINRALVYGSLTVVLGALLAAAVGVGSSLVETTVGRNVGIGISAVAAAVTFQPLRAVIQRAIDRRFYPSKYDAEIALDALTNRIKDEADLGEIRSGIVSTVEMTLHPGSVRLALPGLDASFDADHRLLEGIYAAEANQPIDAASGLLPEEARQAFSLRGVAVLVPMVSHSELTAVLEVGHSATAVGYGAIDLQFLRRMAERVAPAVRYAEVVAREAEERAARQAYEQELGLAQRIQRDLLPREVPRIPGWELAARYEPSRQVSGDLYDFIPLSDGRLVIVIADVTDKGVPAAMVMATCRSVLRAAATSGTPSPGEILARVNALLLPDIPENMFVTCFCSILDPADGRLTFANAGQNLPMLRNGSNVTELMARGMPLGLMADMDYEEATVDIAPGDSVLFYSDGLVEAHNPAHEMFGKERAMDRVRNHAGGPALLDYLVESLVGFAGKEGARDDDVTLVSLRRLPDEAAEPERDLLIRADLSFASIPGGEIEVADTVLTELGHLRLPVRLQDRIRTAVSEAAMNSMEHGNGFDPNLSVRVEVLTGTDTVEIRVSDEGAGMPLDPEDPDIDAKIAGDQTPRGWGIFLIKNMVDELRTSEVEGRVRLDLVFLVPENPDE